MPNLGNVFSHLSHAPPEVATDDMDNIERFFVVLYRRTSSLKKVNEARKQLLTQGNRHLENIPPTKEALRQHVKRAVFQAGHIWGQFQIANPELPLPSDWGWEKNTDDVWHPFWTGSRNYSPQEMVLAERIFQTMERFFKLHGAETIDTPLFELKETFVQNFEPEYSRLMYYVNDQGNESVSLRFDLTVSLKRIF
ncbi:Histidine--tRNA ligase, cytoplasmic [Holothuria leucospilota]|uniref:Histidine--tRNA ligase, cytoplasmic n=1 Tax=Holothuria leucospilota TaxID=206669 RepID=A0A9Q1CUN7_HOLLE|nr:Histidine--tRNA ligase, cytoplasmic [Holothuria leucospilota]